MQKKFIQNCSQFFSVRPKNKLLNIVWVFLAKRLYKNSKLKFASHLRYYLLIPLSLKDLYCQSKWLWIVVKLLRRSSALEPNCLSAIWLDSRGWLSLQSDDWPSNQHVLIERWRQFSAFANFRLSSKRQEARGIPQKCQSWNHFPSDVDCVICRSCWANGNVELVAFIDDDSSKLCSSHYDGKYCWVSFCYYSNSRLFVHPGSNFYVVHFG